MRRLLLVFMIALLPLRGMVGDAMAVAMTSMPAHPGTQPAAAGSTTTPCPDHATVVLPVQGADHDMASRGDGHHSEPPAHDAAHQHTACDLCNGPAMTRAAPAQMQAPAEHGLLVAPVERFASSEPHQGIKPPIS